MATALISAMTGIKVRRDVAMTGEITLRGKVLPIGGLREKTLAAHRGGIRTFILPKRNAKDLSELPEVVKNDLELIEVSTLDEVLDIAFVHDPEHPGRQISSPPSGTSESQDRPPRKPRESSKRGHIDAPGSQDPLPASLHGT